MIQYKKDTDNIVTLTINMEGRQENVINHKNCDLWTPVIDHLQKEKKKGVLKGIIITSAKKNFLEGGDLEYLYTTKEAEKIYELATKLSQFFRDLEHPGVSVVAAINGNALGLGFEMALACHHRIALDSSDIRLGHPEISFGLMPGSGGLIRLLWLLGLEKAFHILTNGRKYRPREALKVGIIDEVAPTHKDMLEQAKKWLLNQDEAIRPWDRKGGRIPGGTANHPKTIRLIQQLTADLSKNTYNNYPAHQSILDTLVEGSKVDFDTALKVERRQFTQLILHPKTSNMIKTFWYDYNAIKKGVNRPKGFGKFRPKEVGVIGAGRMGSGITFCCIKRGIKVVLKDVSKPIAELGKKYTKEQLAIRASNDTINVQEAVSLLDNLTTTEKAENFKDCDLVIEAVYENEMIKSKAIKETEQIIDEYAIFGTNTISIPITKLAKSSFRPEKYVGLHFFYPVEEVPLVEIVKGKETSDETIAQAFDFVRAIRKIPIIVKDAWGFYAARVQNTYILEGVTLLQEGYPAALIENLGVQAGMPKGALEIADSKSLKMVLKYEQQAAVHYGSKYVPHPAVTTLQKMTEELNRTGRFKGKGFYDYMKNESKLLWADLGEHFPITKNSFDTQEIMERMLFVQVIEAIWCMQEKVVNSAAEANLGSVYGWGFPAFSGGVLQYVNSYGLDLFIEKCSVYEKKYGPRFSAPGLLKKMRKEGKEF